MDNNTAYGYRLDDEYTSIYVNLNGYEQLIFYWSLKNQCQKRKPKWRVTKQTVEEDMKIVAYNSSGFELDINGRPARFTWYEYDNTDNSPAHKGSLENFEDWGVDQPESITRPETWAQQRAERAQAKNLKAGDLLG